MFYFCDNLKSLDLSNFDTKNVRTIKQMFLDCVNLEEIIISSSFDTKNVIDMEEMFSGSKVLLILIFRLTLQLKM